MGDVVSTSATTDPITLHDVKRHLNVKHTADDAYIRDLILAATETLKTACNRAFINETRELTMDTFDDSRYVHDRAIYTPVTPLSSVTQIRYLNTSGTDTAFASAKYRVNTAEGSITEEYSETWPATRGVSKDVTITYVAGHGATQTAMPAHVHHALRMMVAHWYRNREHVVIGAITKEIEWAMDVLLTAEMRPQYG